MEGCPQRATLFTAWLRDKRLQLVGPGASGPLADRTMRPSLQAAWLRTCVMAFSYLFVGLLQDGLSVFCLLLGGVGRVVVDTILAGGLETA